MVAALAAQSDVRSALTKGITSELWSYRLIWSQGQYAGNWCARKDQVGITWKNRRCRCCIDFKDVWYRNLLVGTKLSFKQVGGTEAQTRRRRRDREVGRNVRRCSVAADPRMGFRVCLAVRKDQCIRVRVRAKAAPVRVYLLSRWPGSG